MRLGDVLPLSHDILYSVLPSQAKQAAEAGMPIRPSDGRHWACSTEETTHISKWSMQDKT